MYYKLFQSQIYWQSSNMVQKCGFYCKQLIDIIRVLICMTCDEKLIYL